MSFKRLICLFAFCLLGCQDTSGDGKGEGDSDVELYNGTFELITGYARQWHNVMEHSDGDIYLLETGMHELISYGPVGLVSRVSPQGFFEEQVAVDPGNPLHSSEIVEHPKKGLVLAGIRDYGGYTNAYVARISFSERGGVTWSEEFGTGESHEDSGFLGLVGIPGGYHLFGYGGATYGEHVALRTFVDVGGRGGQFALEFERSEGDISEYQTGSVVANGDVLLVGSYGDFLETDWNWSGHVLLIREDETLYQRIGAANGIAGGGGDAKGRIYVFGQAQTDDETYAADVFLAELSPEDLSVIWQRKYDYLHEDYILAGDVNAKGEIVLAWRSFELNNRTAWLGKYDDQGREMWTKTFANREILDVVFSKRSDHILACGLVESEHDGDNAKGWLIKLNDEGEL